MRNKTLYPKVYATILEYTIQGQRVGTGQLIKSFTPAEWEVAHYRPGKRRYYYRNSIMRVRLDSGEELTLDKNQIAYNGKRRNSTQLGCRIKMFHHPNDTRAWRYKLLGE